MNNKNKFHLSHFFQMDSASGLLLMAAAIFAMVLANSPFESLYQQLLDVPVEIRIGALHIHKPLLLWINDGLMAIFFFHVGLELKRELMEGELSQPKNVVLPAIGAIGGMLIPALIYIALNYDNPNAIQGWAIPAATDIAFALGVLSLLGSRVPTSLKVFLTSLAIFDDIGAIVIIAFFYTSKISMLALIFVGTCLCLLFFINRKGVDSKSIYIVIGIIMWTSMLKSGVHATLSAVLLAAFIPMKTKDNPTDSPLKDLEHDLHTVVAFFVLPIFAFANAGINFAGIEANQLIHGVPLGVALGLFLGKQLGVFGFCWFAIKLKLTTLPSNMNWASLYGTAALCGIGFTMSLFIGSLAFEETEINYLFDERIGIILGSIASGITGYVILNRYLPINNDTKK
ncbi:Na+/H+ antiporter NhaA [Marinibactrum halimedae]|uniref:Na(+)/H(+) antiporter NhaA n=1 Tax=Marinibactrum halimedae TaxID=1444977 RepID=A0AA37WP34_9GAMM|nr:Na+/H+ antiporter NhaA [Marinibactrum halimedae]MCD9457633.1 Na+/H+ antiporter NhaA [Marinibactrum halimedae]GLS28055.1 Na(+)/H(+) antiporter NhaA [Marinibactrum halimedae]